MKPIFAAFAVALLLALPSATAAPVPSSLTIPCGGGVTVPVDWHRPATTTPTGLVWLTHGWLGQKSDVSALAQAITAATGAVVVAPTVPSFDPGNGCWILGEPFERAVARLFTGDRAALISSARAAGIITLPEPLVLTGHSAGGQLALSVGGYLAGTAAINNLRSVIAFDGGGDTSGSHATTALAALTGSNWRLVYQVASAPSQSPAGLTGPLLSARPGQFVGLEIVNGCHLDAVGMNYWFIQLLLGCWMRAENTVAVQTIASDWINNALTGSTRGITSGAPGQQFSVGNATVKVLGG